MKKIGKIIALIFLFGIFVFPPKAEARNVFRDLGRGLRRTVKFIVTLPDKVTKPLGPVLGPIAANLLTQNLARNPNLGRYFRGAKNVNRVIGNLDEQKRILAGMQSDFRKQSEDLAAEADAIREYKNEIADEFSQGGITFEEYEDKVMSLDRLADSYDRLSDKFQESADKMTPEQTVKAVSGNVFRRILREVKDAVRFELKNEIRRYLKPEILTLLDTKGADFNRILELLIDSDIEGDTAGMTDEEKAEFRSRVRDQVKNILKSNRHGLKANWREEVRNAIERVKANLEKEKEKLGEEKTRVVPSEKETDEGGKRVGDEDLCPPGYRYSPQSGIECIQDNCNSITSGHWDYTGHCICGSSGSVNENPKDPNKECYFPAENASCPGCLYACVHLDEDCPKAPKN